MVAKREGHLVSKQSLKQIDDAVGSRCEQRVLGAGISKWMRRPEGHNNYGQVKRGKTETRRNNTYPTEFSTPLLQQGGGGCDGKTGGVPLAQKHFFQTKACMGNPFLLVHVLMQGLTIHIGVHWRLGELQPCV